LERDRRQPPCVIPDVCRPGFDPFVESLPVPSEQGSRRFLEAGQVSGHGGHEPVGRLLRLSDAIPAFVRASRLFHELAQRN
jgi:hypothetical protein